MYRAHNNSILNNIASTKQGGGYYRGINFDEGSSYNTIKGNDVMGNEYGICFWTASDSIRSNIITSNNISNNNYGIRFHSGNIHDTIFYLNNFIDNTNNVYSSGSGDMWSSTSKITYTYNCSQYTNYLGNYWSDYTGTDTNNDGMGDAPYSIDVDKDNYPLISPFKEYFGSKDPTVSFNPSKLKIPLNSTNIINLTLDSAQNGLSGYNITISLPDTKVAEIVSFDLPAWATLHSDSTLPTDSFWLKVADLDDQIKSGATNITLATLTLSGDVRGTCNILINVTWNGSVHRYLYIPVFGSVHRYH